MSLLLFSNYLLYTGVSSVFSEPVFAPRRTLTNLLSGVDKLGDDASLMYISSFIDTKAGRTLHGSGGGGGEARRRVSPHSPCECPDYMDLMEQSCLSRRHNMLGTALNDVSGASDSPENMRMLMRQSFWTMYNRSQDDVRLTDSMYADIFNGTNSTPPYLTQATTFATGLKQLTGWFLNFMDFIWSQQFIIADLTKNDTRRIMDLYSSGLGQWSKFINDIQHQEEVVSFSNFQRVLSYLQNFMSKNANLMNIPTADVHKALTMLSDSMEFNEDGSVKLRESLFDSTNDLADKFSEAADFISETFDDHSQSFPQTISSQILAPFTGSATDLVTHFKSATSSKIEEFQKSTQTVLDHQPSDFIAKLRTRFLTDIRDSLASVVENHSDSRLLASKVSHEGTQSVVGNTTRIGDFVSRSVSTDRSVLQSSVALNSKLFSAVNGSASSTEKRLLANSTSNSRSAEQNTNNQISSMLTSAQTSASNVINIAQNAILPIVDSVGVTARTGSDSVSSQYNDMSSSFSEQLHGFSMDSASVSSDIWKQMMVSSGKISLVSSDLTGQINSKASSAFGSISDNLWQDPVNGDKEKSVNSVKVAGASKAESINALINTRESEFGSRHAVLAADIESRIGSILVAVQNSTLTSQEKTLLIRKLLNSYVSVPEDDTSIRNRMSGAADMIGDQTSAMLSMFTDSGKSIGSSFSNLPPQLSPAMAQYLLENSKHLSRIQSQVDNVGDSVSQSANEFGDNVASVRQTTGRLSDAYNTIRSTASDDDKSISFMPRQIEAKSMQQTANLAALYSGNHLTRLELEKLQTQDGIHQSAFDAMSRTRDFLSDNTGRQKTILKYIGNQERSGGKFVAQREKMKDKLSRLAIQYASALDTLADTSRLPITSSDVHILSMVEDATGSRALSGLTEISTTANVTANTILQTMASLIQKYVDMYKMEEEDAQKALDQVSSAMSKPAPIPSSLYNLANLARNVSDALTDDAPAPSNQTLPGIPSKLGVVAPISLLKNQSLVAETESSVVSNLTQKILSLNHSMMAQMTANLESQKLEAHRLDAITGLKTQSGSSTINKTLADNQKLAADTNAMMNDYRTNLQAKMDLMRSNPRFLMDQVTSTKGKMTTAMAHLQATLAQSMSDTGSEMAGETGAAALLAKYELNALKKMFGAFASYASAEKFELYLDQLNDFLVHTVGANMVKSLNSNHRSIGGKKRKLSDMRAQILSQADDMQGEYDALETQENELAETVTEWSYRQQSKLSSLNESITSLKSKMANVPDTKVMVSAALRNITSLILETFPEYADKMKFHPIK